MEITADSLSTSTTGIRNRRTLLVVAIAAATVAAVVVAITLDKRSDGGDYLDHTIITSPIDGVVISRNVDVGQTVAASLQAPILFVIANDLSNSCNWPAIRRRMK
jgi:multidrug efflux pump subunit AcrA (membrane-fusion protein)